MNKWIYKCLFLAFGVGVSAVAQQQELASADASQYIKVTDEDLTSNHWCVLRPNKKKVDKAMFSKDGRFKLDTYVLETNALDREISGHWQLKNNVIYVSGYGQHYFMPISMSADRKRIAILTLGVADICKDGSL